MLRIRITNADINDSLNGIQFIHSESVQSVQDFIQSMFLDLKVEIFDDAVKQPKEKIRGK